MAKHAIRTDAAPPPAGPYSQAVRAGDYVFVAGQVPFDPATGELVPGGIEEQTERVLANVAAILDAAGAGMADVVKATVHLAELESFHAFNAVYERHFPGPKPVRTTVGSQLAGFLVEIDVIAYVGSG